MLLRASSIACWTVFDERQARSTTFLSETASRRSSFMAMDSSGVVTSQVARRGRVVVSPPIFVFCVASTAPVFSLAVLARQLFPWLLATDASRCKGSQSRGSVSRGAARNDPRTRVTVCRVLETRQGCGLVIYSRTFLIHSRPHLLWTLTEGKGRYPRALDLALRTSPARGRGRKWGAACKAPEEAPRAA